MSEFSLDSFAALLFEAAVVFPEAEKRALKKAGEIVQAEAKAEIGHYQDGAGPFAAWPPLKTATIAAKANGDTPLLETGEMRDSIGLVVEGHGAHVGSNDDKAVWQELGTSRGIPPRSFLGGAAVRKSKEVAETMSREVMGVLVKQEMPGIPNGARQEVTIK